MPEEWISSKTRRTNWLARGGLLGRAGLHLGLDVQLDLVGVVRLDQVEDVLELDHPEALDLLLLGEAGELLVAAVHRLDLGEGQVLDVLADVRVRRVAREGRTRVLALLRADLTVVVHDHLLVLGDLGVELEGAHPESHGLGEALQGLLGGHPDPAAVRLQVEVRLLWRHLCCGGRGS